MSRSQQSRRDVVGAILEQLRAGSTRGVLLHAAVAERLGLNASDHKCADLMLSQPGPTTPGQLAELTGLSTGAITGVLDRLEQAGFVERTHDRADRRRILVRVTNRRGPDMEKMFAPLRAATERMCDEFTTHELEVVLRFMRASATVLEAAMFQLRTVGPVSAQVGGPAPAASPRRAAAGRKAAPSKPRPARRAARGLT
jgi:DNA-binding MarR family transcriptional regulator